MNVFAIKSAFLCFNNHKDNTKSNGKVRKYVANISKNFREFYLFIILK